MKLRFSDEKSEITENKPSLFLAGPTPRSSNVPSWRKDAIKILEELNFDGDVLIPEKKDWSVKFQYEDQINWEKYGLENSKTIVFWVPRYFPDMKGLTTNVEFGIYITKSPNKVLYGRPDDAEQVRYLDLLYNQITGRIHVNSLYLLLTEAVNY